MFLKEFGACHKVLYLRIETLAILLPVAPVALPNILEFPFLVKTQNFPGNFVWQHVFD